MYSRLDDQGRVIDLYAIGDGGLEYSTEQFTGASPVYYSPSAPMSVLLAEPSSAPAADRVQPTGGCSGCGGGGDTGEALMPLQPAHLTGDTRVDAGVSIGWRELLVILVVAAAARYFELI